MNSGKVLLGVLAGAAVGAALGLLFAPEKGSISRHQISSKSEDFWETLKCKFGDLISSATDEIRDVKKDVKEEAEDMYAKGKEKVQEAKSDFKAHASMHP